MQSKEYNHIVPYTFTDRIRLSKYIVGKFPLLESASAAKKAIKNGEITINGRVGQTADWIVAGDKIDFKTYFQKPISKTDLDVVFEDDYLLVINKPPGMLSSGNSRSLQSELKSYPESKTGNALFYPYLVHRLDRQTSGLIIAARTMDCRRQLGLMIDQNQLTKEYSLMVEGHFNQEIKYLDDDIDEKSAKTEILKVKHLKTMDPSSYVRVRLHTGRTHQIRKHFFGCGYPIVGDDIYNKDGLSFGRGLFLMSDYLKILHPVTDKQMEVEVKLHDKFLKYL